MNLSDIQHRWLSEVFPYQTIEQMQVYGSKRSFFTVSNGDEQRVLIVDDDAVQFERYLLRADMFRLLNVRVPQVYASEAKLGLILVEFLPGNLLESIFHNSVDYMLSYRSVIDEMNSWQKQFDSQNNAGSYRLPVYDVEFARNETRYFQQRFLEDYVGANEEQIRSLDFQLDCLAEQAASIRQTLIHRDFQSQNIILNATSPSFVDFQSAMMGPYCYDLASLLYDNYVNIPTDQKILLKDYFFSKLDETKNVNFAVCALQRTFQALGAYGYLSGTLKRKQYLRYIPQGMRHLDELSENFPWLKTDLFPLLTFR